MSDWMKEARAKARELDQSRSQSPYKERLRVAGEQSKRKTLPWKRVGEEPKIRKLPMDPNTKVEIALLSNTKTDLSGRGINKSPSISPTTQNVPTARAAANPNYAQNRNGSQLTEQQTAGTISGTSVGANNYLLSDNLKTAGESMAKTVSTGLFTNGAIGNAAVKNLRSNGFPELSDVLKSQLDALERERYIAGLKANQNSAGLQDNGQPGKQRTAAHTIIDTINEGAGLFNQAVFSTADFVANAIPRIEGIVFNEKPEATFTGQVLRPLTDATGWLVDWAKKDTAASHQRVQADTANNKVANAVVSFAPSVVAALPNAALAFMSAGASVGGQLAAQSTGLSGTVATAASKMLHNPMTAVSFAQMLGPGYDQAKARGANEAEAMTAATISALFNTIVEVSGGIEALPMEIRNVDLSNAQKAWKWVTSALGEGKEEVVQGVVSEMTNKAVFEENKPLLSLQDETAVINPERMTKEFGGGTAIGGILGGGQILADISINKLNEIDLSNVTTNDARKVRNLENASKKQVEAFVQKAYLNQNECQYMKISEVTPSLAEDLKTVGLYVENGNHVLRDNDLRHIVYRHGKYSNDKYKVLDEDYIHLCDIIENYDELYLGYPTNDGNTTIVYEKTIDQKVFYVEEVLEDGVLATKQMLKVGKKRKPSFLKKYTRITDATLDTDVPPEAEPTGLY